MNPPGSDSGRTFKALLFDLDGTLLQVRMSRFLEAYFPLLAARFGADDDLPRFRGALIDSVRDMLESRNDRKLLFQVFLDSFAPKVDRDAAGVTTVFEGFHRDGIDALRPLTRPVPEARPLLEKAASLGYEIALATNPVFVRQAIDARLNWAGLGEFPFLFVSSADNMHFCKPHSEYFEEVLENIGRKPADCLMIGDDPKMDMPAREAGIATWFVPSEGKSLAQGGSDYSGSLADLASWVEDHEAPAFPP
jgi:FMN phosphatase YigB (HAD superfamily)